MDQFLYPNGEINFFGVYSYLDGVAFQQERKKIQDRLKREEKIRDEREKKKKKLKDSIYEFIVKDNTFRNPFIAQKTFMFLPSTGPNYRFWFPEDNKYFGDKSIFQTLREAHEKTFKEMKTPYLALNDPEAPLSLDRAKELYELNARVIKRMENLLSPRSPSSLSSTES